MFEWFSSVLGKVLMGISSLLIVVAGAVSPAPASFPLTTTAPTSTSQTAAIEVASSTEATPLAKIKNTSVFASEKKTPAPVNPTPNQILPIVAQSQQSTVQAPQGIQCNGKLWNSCPDGQSFVCPATGNAYCSVPPTSNTNIHTGTNYYDQYKVRVKTVLAMDKSFQTWLQDTSNQFRSASLTLAGYNLGGLYGQSRDAAIKLANAEVSVISSLQTNNAQWITQYENIVEILNNDPSGFIDITAFNKLSTPDAEQTDIDNVKKSINSTLDSVLTSLQYH